MTEKKKGFDRFIDGIEWVGNKLPHPFWLFVLLSGIVIVLSVILSTSGVEVTYMQAARSASEAPTEVVAHVTNLLSKESIQSVLTNFTTIYASFAPLGLVMIMMLGVGMLEQTGMLSALIRKTILGAPESLLIFVIAFVGVNANLASDAGIVIVPSVAGAIFHSMGLNPWIGIIAGYAAAEGGFTANVFIGGTDALLSGITESAALGIDAPVHPMMNYFFMCASCLVIVAGTVLVTKFYITPKLGMKGHSQDTADLEKQKLTADEERGLRYCGIVSLVYFAALIIAIIPKNSVFRNDEGGLLPRSPLLSSVVAILFFFFFFLAIAYGKGSGSIKTLDDVPKYMQKGVAGALGFIVIALPASIFIQLFNMSNISTIVGVLGGQALEAMNFSGYPLLLCFVAVCTIVNIFVTSGSAKWLILAPIFVPMFARIGFSPAMTQVTYRIADTCTNIISPLDYYVPVAMGLLSMYNPDPDRKVGIGTIIALCMPYSIVYMISLLIQLFIWFVFKLDIGPGTPMFL